MVNEQEILMLLGDKDILLYEKEKEIRRLKEIVNNLNTELNDTKEKVRILELGKG